MIIESLEEVAEITARHKKEGKTVGLITGCFDIIHAGHMELFEIAKKHCNIIVVGVDSDENVRLNKGSNRPINSYKYREYVLNNCKNVDYIFKVYNKHNVKEYFEYLYKELLPTHIITHTLADTYAPIKKSYATKYNITFIVINTNRLNSTTSIAQKLGFEI